MAEAGPEKTLYLIDGTSNIFRAFYAVRPLSSPAGRPTHATYGFAQMLRKLLQERDPGYIAVTFDRPEKTHRHQVYPAYKANRQAPPEGLVEQIPDIKRICRLLGVPAIEQAGYEADDLMGTLARKATEDGFQVIVVSSDKDLLQLVSESVRVLHPVKGEILDREGVRQTFGVYPEQVADVLALMGDSSDNVPGVPGIGEKGARELIATFGTLEECLRRASEVTRKSYRESLLNNPEQARLSRDLVTIHADVPLEWEPASLRRGEVDVEEARSFFRELGFQRMLEDLEEKAPPMAADGEVPPEEPLTRISNKQGLEELRKHLVGARRLAIIPGFTSIEPMRAELSGLALASSSEAVYWIEVTPEDPVGGDRVTPTELIQALGSSFESASLPKLSDDLKSLEVFLLRNRSRLRGGDVDSTLVAYLLDPESGDHSLARLEATIAGNDRPSGSPSGTGQDPASGCRRLLRLEETLKGRLREAQLERLYRELELPLTSILARMEFTGVRIDAAFLRDLSNSWRAEMKEMETRIYALAGQEFNIQSPKQLGEVLFQKLGLTPGRKTEKVKSFSTGMDVLEGLASSHPLPAAVLEYRSLSKLISTYVDALPELINPRTGRVHASFNQTTAATGRLSSSDPNLQNIPIRSTRGRLIRRAFIAEDGWRIVTADYSQIELRILAHLSGDPEMMRAFREGEDIHRRTASQIFSVTPDGVTPEMRDQAKTINFGILYGMGAFRLARELGIPLPTAREMIGEYFRKFQGVRAYMDQVIESTRRTELVSTLFGRIRKVPEINSRNMNLRNQGIRVAVNTTVQGTAADVIKMAMLLLDRRLEERRMRSRLLIQVHDELVLEAPSEETEACTRLVQECMEGAVPLDIPLKAEVKSGSTWLETK